MAEFYTHFSYLIHFTDRKSFGWSNINECFGATLNEEDIDA
ncbi:hypothetical protein [Pseudorhodobacter wandonensis]|nr:hypothetical protein [Pseudorhodobacter wandonensis]